jgi:hypothetical protein
MRTISCDRCATIDPTSTAGNVYPQGWSRVRITRDGFPKTYEFCRDCFAQLEPQLRELLRPQPQEPDK